MFYFNFKAQELAQLNRTLEDSIDYIQACENKIHDLEALNISCNSKTSQSKFGNNNHSEINELKYQIKELDKRLIDVNKNNIKLKELLEEKESIIKEFDNKSR